jgi:hypothetical protein
MTTARLAVSLDAELADQIRDAARGTTVSGWLADAAERKLRAEGLREAVVGWQDDHGALTEAERRRARRDLGIDHEERD